MPNNQNQAGAAGRGTQWAPWVMLGTVCALVIGFFAWSARPGSLEIGIARAEDSYYNLLVQGFCAGQLNLKTEVPPGLAQLADPYDPGANAQYRGADGHPLHDLSYYHGKLYSYFGITPALVLFWPFAALTGHYLWHLDAVVIFSAIGFLASVGLLCLVWRRYFPEIGLTVVVAGTLALGLAPFTPFLLSRANVYEVATSSSYALTMLALLALWEACHRPQQRGRWLAAASLAYGLAVGARPNVLFGAVILLLPVALAWREGRKQKEEGRRQNEEGRMKKAEVRGQKSEAGDQQQATRPPAAVLLRRTGNLAQSQIANRKSQILVPLLAVTGPITCIGLGLMLYNTLRFDNPLEFGLRYQLASNDNRVDCWSPHFLGFNLWVYFLGPARWGAQFPFVHDIQMPPMPAGHGVNEHPFGVLTNIPLVWLALAAPLAWRGRPAEARRLLCGFVAAVALLFATRVLTMGFFRSAHARYEWEFCPVLVLLAVVGILGLERALAGRPAWRRAARWSWGLLLAFSLAFNLLASAISHAEYHELHGSFFFKRGQVNEAIAHYQTSLVLQPDAAVTHYNLGVALGQIGQTDDAMRHYQEALRLEPDYTEAHINLGGALGLKGQTDEAIHQFQAAVRLKPEQADTHYNLAVALSQKGRTGEAIRHYQEAVRLKPDRAEAHNNLGSVFYQQGRTGEAIHEFQEALRLKPDYAEARKNLVVALAAQANPAPSPGAATNR